MFHIGKMLRSPKIFISYSRDKIQIAEFFKTQLEQKGYSVFFDKETIKIGDSFPNRIESFLRICDGVVILISNSSIKSEWCRYEYHYSFFKKKVIIPIITEQFETGLKNPLTYFQKDINYVNLNDNSYEEMNSVFSKIEDKLESVKSVSRKKIIKWFSLSLFILVLVFLFFQFGIKKINSYVFGQDRDRLLQKIETSNHVYTINEINEISTKFNNDQKLAEKLYLLSSNDKVSNYARLNSNILTGHILSNYNIYQKNQIEDLSWKNSFVSNNILADKVFLKCKIENVKFDKTNIQNIAFTQSTLSNLSFVQCNFAGVLINPEEASVIDFIGCKFLGGTIELKNFLKVNFKSKLSDDATIVDASMSTFFENCLFESEFLKDKQNSIDFTRIEAVKFENINFSNCTFRGYLDSDWFSNCGFYNCTFSDNIIVNKLKSKNFVE